jgi:hypothetical protein
MPKVLHRQNFEKVWMDGLFILKKRFPNFFVCSTSLANFVEGYFFGNFMIFKVSTIKKILGVFVCVHFFRSSACISIVLHSNYLIFCIIFVFRIRLCELLGLPAPRGLPDLRGYPQQPFCNFNLGGREGVFAHASFGCLLVSPLFYN